MLLREAAQRGQEVLGVLEGISIAAIVCSGEESRADEGTWRRARWDRPDTRANMADVLVHRVSRQRPLVREKEQSRVKAAEGIVAFDEVVSATQDPDTAIELRVDEAHVARRWDRGVAYGAGRVEVGLGEVAAARQWCALAL